MSTALLAACERLDLQVQADRRSATACVVKARARNGFSPYAATRSYTGQTAADQGRAQLQYDYFKDWVYAAVRPIAVRIAGQPFKVGKPPGQGPKPQKALALARAPAFIRKNPEGVEIVESHPLLDLLDAPNACHGGWELKYLAAVNLLITGESVWWLIRDRSQWEIWPIPTHWAEPHHEGGRVFSSWTIRPPNSAQSWEVPGEEVVRYSLPDPANPLRARSPLQSAARAVSIDDELTKCQLQGYKNQMRPSVILKAGRLPDPQGGVSEVRRVLTPAQRSQLLEAVRMAWVGWQRHNDPAIVDGLIEEIVPFGTSPKEMDFMQSAKQVQDRIFLAFGVNPLSVGAREGGNRAQAYVADDHLCSNVVNPLIELISQGASRRLAPLFGGKIMVWVEEAIPHDADLELRRWNFGHTAGVLTDNEIRTYLGLPEREGCDTLPHEREEAKQAAAASPEPVVPALPEPTEPDSEEAGKACADLLGWEKYHPRQPRHPAGTGRGGQFASYQTAGNKLGGLLASQDGFTYNPVHGNSPTTGMVVSPYPDHEEVFEGLVTDPDVVAGYQQRHRDKLVEDPLAQFSGYYNREENKTYFDVVVVVNTHDDALEWAIKHEQQSCYDIETGKVIEVGADARRRRRKAGVLHLPEGRDARGDGGVAGKAPRRRGRQAGQAEAGQVAGTQSAARKEGGR